MVARTKLFWMLAEYCPNCGGPLPPGRSRVDCPFCATQLIAQIPIKYRIADPLPELAGMGPKVQVGSITYWIHGLLGRGDACDVWLAQKASRLTEMVVIKSARGQAEEHKQRLDSEWRELELLLDSDAGSEYAFASLLPSPVHKGQAIFVNHSGSASTVGLAALVYRWRSGFQHTFEDIRRQHPGGIEGQNAIWLWNRVLSSLGWLHRQNRFHGAILPSHLLVHPRDHGVVFCGWSSMARIPAPKRLISKRWEAFYLDEPGAKGDIRMSAACIDYLLQGAAVDQRLLNFVRTIRNGQFVANATVLKSELGELARGIYGPPRYHKLPLEGWK